MKVKLAQNKLMWVIVISLVLRIAVAIYMGDDVSELPGISDQISYHTLATRVTQGAGFTFPAQWWPITEPDTFTAFWSYLYTLYLAVIYILAGVHPLAARILQAAIVGVGMPWLAYRLGKRAWPGRAVKVRGVEVEAGLVAAAWVAAYPYFIYYGAALMTESFYMSGILWALDCGLRIAHSHDKEGARWGWRWVELGAALGVTVLLRQVFLLFVPFLVIWILWVKAGEAGAKWKQATWKTVMGSVIAGVIVIGMIAPFTILNYREFGRFVLLNTNAGYAFFWANHPIHEGSFVALLTEDMPSYQELIPSELRGLDEAALERELMKRGIQFVVDDPLRYVRLSISRIADHFIFWPLPSSSTISNLTRVGSFGVALPFMLLGGIVWIAEERKRAKKWAEVSVQPGALMLLFIAVYVGVHLLTWAGIRYRLPTDAVSLVFAAGGVVWIFCKLIRSSPNPIPKRHEEFEERIR